MKKRILALALALALVVGIVPAQAAGSPFWDVPETHWAYQDVMAAYQDGVMKGVGGGKFNPNGYVTVAEWCCILARGFFPYEIESKQYVNWYNREMEVLESHYVYSKRSDDEIKNVSGYASRSFMADTIYIKNFIVTGNDLLSLLAELKSVQSPEHWKHQGWASEEILRQWLEHIRAVQQSLEKN